MKRIKSSHNSIILVLLTIVSTNMCACPFIINNDGPTAILIVDPYNKQAVHINPGQEAEIDPSISGWLYYFYHEKLDIYVPQADKPGAYYRRYQLVEKYCTADKTKLSLSDIVKFINEPTNRFMATTFREHKHSDHVH